MGVKAQQQVFRGSLCREVQESYVGGSNNGKYASYSPNDGVLVARFGNSWKGEGTLRGTACCQGMLHLSFTYCSGSPSWRDSHFAAIFRVLVDATATYAWYLMPSIKHHSSQCFGDSVYRRGRAK